MTAYAIANAKLDAELDALNNACTCYEDNAWFPSVFRHNDLDCPHALAYEAAVDAFSEAWLEQDAHVATKYYYETTEYDAHVDAYEKDKWDGIPF